MTYIIVRQDKYPLNSGDYITIEGAVAGKVVTKIRYFVRATESLSLGRLKLYLEEASDDA